MSSIERIVREVYERPGKLMCTKLDIADSIESAEIASQIFERWVVEPNGDDTDINSKLERIVIPAWTVESFIASNNEGKKTVPRVYPSLTHLTIGGPDRDRCHYGSFTNELRWLSAPSRLSRMDDSDRHRTRGLQNLMFSLPALAELDLRGYNPFWWPMLTWSTDYRFPPLLRLPLQVLHVPVDFEHLEQAAE